MKIPHEENSAAAHIARKAIPFMGDHSIPITPRNYFVWYEYFHGMMLELKTTLDELIHSGTKFDDRLNQEIYDLFFDRKHAEEQERKLLKEMKTVEEVNASADKILGPIVKELDGASKSTDDYSAKLKEMAGKIKDDKNIDDMHTIMMTLAKETEKISDKNRSISTGIKDSTQQLEDLRAKLAEAKAEAMLDDLTKIKNRRAFNERIVEIVAIVNKKNSSAVLGIVDIDKFKRINDTYGHPVGDKALIAIAGQLTDNIKKGDEVFRVGGEEFAVIFPDCSLDKGFKRIDLARASIAGHQFAIRNIVENITVSVGLAEIKKGASQKEVEKLADMALYLAKESGRNQVRTQKDLKAQDVTGA